MITARKRFGQNFLKDTSVLHRIIQSMPVSDRKLIEIGPGLGDLTQRLLEVKPVVAYEIDRDLIALLKDKFSKEINEGNFSIVEGDVLKRFSQGSLSDEPYDMVANLPYYIATTIILEAFERPTVQEFGRYDSKRGCYEIRSTSQDKRVYIVGNLGTKCW